MEVCPLRFESIESPRFNFWWRAKRFRRNGEHIFYVIECLAEHQEYRNTLLNPELSLENLLRP